MGISVPGVVDGDHELLAWRRDGQNALGADGARVGCCRWRVLTDGVIPGTSMRNVFQAFCDAEFDRDWQWARDTYGDDADGSLLLRTQRGYDAPMHSWR